MRTIKAEPISHENFAPFGQFYPMGAPEGYALCGELHSFFPDRLIAGARPDVGYSPILVKKPQRYCITQQEYHTTTWEMILPLNDDMILHCSPASGGVPANDYARAFLVPKNTLVKINPAVWHLAPLPAKADTLSAMIILPVCTYANDCTVVDLTPEQQFEIVR